MRKGSLLWIISAILFLLGFSVYFFIPGYSFSGLVLFAAGGAVLCFRLLGLIRKDRLRKTLKGCFAGLLAAGVLAAGITGAVIITESRGQADLHSDYIIVLGAGVNGTVPSLSLQQRLDAAFDYLTENPDTVCVVSGCQGSGEDISEARCMYDTLTAMGIDGSRIWMEDKAENTRQNIRYSLDVIEARTGLRPNRAGIVSSEYHLYRAHMFAEDQGLDSFGIPARTSWISLRINYYLREIAAVWYYTIFGG